MDVPTANQSQCPSHTWVGQEDWSPHSCTHLQSLQHLALSSSCSDRSQAFIPGALRVNDAQPITRDPRLSSILPPPSHPLLDKGTQQYAINQTPLNPSSQHQAMSPPFLLLHPHQMPQDAAWSLHEEDARLPSRGPGPAAYQNPACSPEPVFGLGNVKTAGGFVRRPTSPTSPLHQPPDGGSSHYTGLFS